MKTGDSFKGRILEQRLDSGRNPFRKVFRSGSEVIVIFENRLIPKALMVDTPNGPMPVEYSYILSALNVMDSNPKFLGTSEDAFQLRQCNPFGLPEIYGTGQDDEYTWVIEEYLTGYLLEDAVHILGLTDMSKKTIRETYCCIAAFIGLLPEYFELFLNPPCRICVTPRSIFICDDPSREHDDGVDAKLMLGDMFCPSSDWDLYPASYDLRYVSTDRHFGKKSVLRSIALVLLTLFRDSFPWRIGRGGSPEAIGRTIRTRSADVLSYVNLPTNVSMALYRCLQEEYLRPGNIYSLLSTPKKLSGESRPYINGHFSFAWQYGRRSRHPAM